MYLHHLRTVIARLHPEIRAVDVGLPGSDRETFPVTITAPADAIAAITARLNAASASITPRGYRLVYTFAALPEPDASS